MFSKKITTQVIINAPSSTVRRLFLDFPKWDDWNGLVSNIGLPDGKTAETISEGDKMKVRFSAMGGMDGEVTIKSNNEKEFTWVGVLGSPYVFGGTHFFEFHEEVSDGVTKTKLVHGENFSGLLIPIYFGVLVGMKKTEEEFGNCSTAFKEFVESNL